MQSPCTGLVFRPGSRQASIVEAFCARIQHPLSFDAEFAQ